MTEKKSNTVNEIHRNDQGWINFLNKGLLKYDKLREKHTNTQKRCTGQNTLRNVASGVSLGLFALR